jgi:hypothetical protein
MQTEPARSTLIASEQGWLDGSLQHCQANQDWFAELSRNVGAQSGMDTCCQSCLERYSIAAHIECVDGNLETKPTREPVPGDVPFPDQQSC